MNLTYKATDLQDDIGHLATSIKVSTFKPDLIVGLARGGLIPAVCLSHKLKIEMESVNWPREENLRDECYHVGDYLAEGRQILLVDDILDSGRSIQSFLTHLQNGQVEDLKLENLRVAALIRYSDCEFKGDFVPLTIDRNVYDWVDFWWEKI